MPRKLWILSIVPILATAGCQTLERVEVWKQQTFFSPPPRLVVSNGDPCAPAAPNCAPLATQPYYSGATPTTTQKPMTGQAEYQSGETVISDEAVPSDAAPSLGPAAGSSEEIHGVLEQP